MIRFKQILFISLFVWSYKILAWGEVGHKLVAQVAKACLSKNIKDSISFYLGNDSFGDAAVWMDEVRSDHSYDYMKPWHYVNVERDKTRIETKEPNIVNQLHAVIQNIKSSEYIVNSISPTKDEGIDSYYKGRVYS